MVLSSILVLLTLEQGDVSILETIMVKIKMITALNTSMVSSYSLDSQCGLVRG